MGLFLGKTQIAYRGVQFDDIYPVGSIYISIDGTHPALGTWEQLATGRCLWNVESTSASLGNEIAAGLPNITGYIQNTLDVGGGTGSAEGAFAGTTKMDLSGATGSGGNRVHLRFNANKSNPIYDDANTTVQPPAIGVTMWERTA